MQAGWKQESGWRPISTDPGARAREVAAEIVRVQTTDPLGRRNLLESLADVLPKEMGNAVRAALANIPKNPGFGLEGGMANKAEESLLESIRFGLENHRDAKVGMKFRLLRLALDNMDVYGTNPATARASALLSWRMLNAVHELVQPGRQADIRTRWSRPAPKDDLARDIAASKANLECIRFLFDVEKEKWEQVSSLGRVQR